MAFFLAFRGSGTFHQRSARAVLIAGLLGTGLIACGGGGDASDKLSLATTWSVSLNNPTDSCVRPGSVLVPLVSAMRTDGSEISDPDYTVSAVPASAVTQGADGRLSIHGEGPLTLTFTYLGKQTRNSTIAPQLFALTRDGTAPAIVVTSPNRGEMRQTSGNDDTVNISGSVHDSMSPVRIVLVNQDILVQDGDADTVQILTTQPATWGTNIVRVRAADACGNTAFHTQSFLQSDTWLAPALTQSTAARVPNASEVRMDQAGFDDNNRDDFDDLVTLGEHYLQTSLTGLVNDFVATIPTRSVDGVTCTYSADPLAAVTMSAASPTLRIMLEDGYAVVRFTVRDLSIPVTYRQVCRGLFGNELSNVFATFDHQIDSLVTDATVIPSVSNRQLVTDIQTRSTVTGFTVDSSTNPNLASAVNLALPFADVEGLIEDAIDSSLADAAEDLIATGVSRLTQVVPVQFPPPIDLTLNVAGDWTQVGVNPAAFTMELGHYVYPAALATPYATDAGAIHRALASRALVPHPGAALTYGINDDAINQTFWALWYGGGLELSGLEDYLSALPGLGVDPTGLSLELSGLLPPVIMPAPEPSHAILGLTDVHLTGSIDLDQNSTLSGSGTVRFDVYAGLLTDGRTGFDIASNSLNLLLGDIGSQFYLHVVEIQLDGVELDTAGPARAEIEDYIRDVVRPLLEQLASDLGQGVPLPQFQVDFPEASFGSESGFILDIVALTRDDDRYVASVDTDDAYAPPVVVLDNWDELGAEAMTAAQAAADGWLSGAEIRCNITSTTASGPAIWRNSDEVTNEIKQALVAAGAPDFVAREWNRVFRSAWFAWGNTLSIPSLPWFPAFAGDDYLSGVPETSAATTGPIGTLASFGRDELTRAELLQELHFRLSDYLDQPGAAEAVDAFATDVSSRFDVLLATGTMDNVEGWAVYPDFAAYVVLVTVQSVLFVLTQESDFFPTLWPIPPPRGPLTMGLCTSGRFGNSSFQ